MLRRNALSACHAALRGGRRWGSGGGRKAKAPAVPASDASAYKQLTAVEHVLHRPEMYIGPVLPRTEPAWVFEDGGMVYREVSYVPALLKLFDELLVNAMDNVQRKAGTTSIEVAIRDDGVLSVYNSGLGIPVVRATAEVHGDAAAGMWLPQLVLGELYTGSNFEDGVGRTVGGRHGFGAKLANIFSTEFTVETADTRSGHTYAQTWRANMSEVGAPAVSALPEQKTGSCGSDYMRVTMLPDYARLGGPAPGGRLLDADTVALLTRRVYEAAACVSPAATVRLNGEPVSVSGLAALMQLYPKREEAAASVVHSLGPRWRVGVAASPAGDFAHVSFVNAVATSRGGTHVEAVERQLLKALAPKLERQLLKALGPKLAPSKQARAANDPLPPSAIRSHLMLFVECQVEDPDFDSQVKERLTTPAANFGSAVVLTDKFVDEVAALPWLRQAVQEEWKAREARQLVRAVGGKSRRTANVNVDDLEDAEWAGTGQSDECTLILTEGDSAKALAVAGFEEVGRERWGVFPLKGKVLNVRGVPLSRVTKNKELVEVMRALGINPTSEPTINPATGRVTGLRYGRLMLMTDQDEDGAHIKGLVISMLHHFWPVLTKADFLQEFVTPLLKATKKGAAGTPPLEFYSSASYERWYGSLPPNEVSSWKVKFYKGLGTSTAAEARSYFSAMGHHRVRLISAEGGPEDNLIDMAFSPTRAADRKTWMQDALAAGKAHEVEEAEADAGPVVAEEPAAAPVAARGPSASEYDAMSVSELRSAAQQLGVETVPNNTKNKAKLLAAIRKHRPADASADASTSRSLESFINSELVEYSLSSTRRAIPSLVDGLKPSQRKVMHACFKDKVFAPNERKVSQLASRVAEVTQYHHGEVSLVSTIVKMAQDYVGTSNLPLLKPNGMFGTRAQGGKDAAAARYIFTSLSPVARHLFPQADYPILEFNVEDGEKVEPTHFVPLLPVVLLNGATGVGTGWSTNVWRYHPLHVLEAVRGLLRSEPTPLLQPWARGFRGTFEGHCDKAFESVGIAELTAKGVEITELPLGTWTQDYKEWLLAQQKLAEPPWEDFSERHTGRHVHFILHLSPRQLASLEQKEDIARFLQLRQQHSLANMHVFDEHGSLIRLDSADEAVRRFVPVRLNAYAARKAHQLVALGKHFELLAAQARFISLVASGEVVVTRVARAVLTAQLQSLGFSPNDPTDQVAESQGGGAEDAEKPKGVPFDHLLRLSIGDLTMERVAALEKRMEATSAAMRELESKTPVMIYEEELDDLKPKLEAFLAGE